MAYFDASDTIENVFMVRIYSNSGKYTATLSTNTLEMTLYYINFCKCEVVLECISENWLAIYFLSFKSINLLGM